MRLKRLKLKEWFDKGIHFRDGKLKTAKEKYWKVKPLGQLNIWLEWDIEGLDINRYGYF
jgi:hypothetical protein